MDGDFRKLFIVQLMFYVTHARHFFKLLNKVEVSKKIKEKTLVLFPCEYDNIVNQIGNFSIAGQDFTTCDYQ